MSTFATCALDSDEGARRLGPWLFAAGARLDGWADFGGRLVQSGPNALDQHPFDAGGVVNTVETAAKGVGHTVSDVASGVVNTAETVGGDIASGVEDGIGVRLGSASTGRPTRAMVPPHTAIATRSTSGQRLSQAE